MVASVWCLIFRLVVCSQRDAIKDVADVNRCRFLYFSSFLTLHAAMKLHPDRNPGDEEANAKFQKVSAAYEVCVSVSSDDCERGGD